jgi:hypothetical protein
MRLVDVCHGDILMNGIVSRRESLTMHVELHQDADTNATGLKSHHNKSMWELFDPRLV